MQVSNPMFERELELLPDVLSGIERNSYLEYAINVINSARHAVKMPTIVMKAFTVIRRAARAARSARSAVRQTFAARKAEKSSDSGGDPDGRPRPQQSYTLKSPSNTRLSTAFSFGGAL